MEQTIIEIVMKYPLLASILMGIGILRAVFKPIMTVLESYVQATESTKDDEKLAALKSSKIYKGIVWFLDYTASIKLPKAK